MTINLSKNYDFVLSEQKWQKYWKEKKVYQYDKSESRENTFVVDTPPPTVSGQLHMGHVFSYTQADFIVRFQRMMGKNIFYPMGFDDNGLPTERLVEKQKNIKANGLDRADFVKICKEVVESEEEKFRTFFSQIALSVDWSLEYQTISNSSTAISQMSFLDLISKDEIYRDDQPMLWDPVDQTALAQADIEDKVRDSVMNDIIFTSEDGENLMIATTRPELLPACVAVFFHPEDKRYKHLEGKYALSPLFNIKIPILADSLVQMDKGTGLVMCCTFGDATDIIWWKTHKLPSRVILDKAARIIEMNFQDVAANQYAASIKGMKVGEARKTMIEHLRGAGLLQGQTAITQSVKCAERSGAPLEILMTPQWFVKTLKHKEALLQKSEELNWYPKFMKHRLDNWINSLAWDWCISRQRFFGVPFPVWYSKREGEEGKPIFASKDQLPVDPLKDLPAGYLADEVEADKDVMDTWATSAVSPQLSSFAISKDFAIDYEKHQKLFSFDLRPQAHEIIRVWTFYTMLKSYLHENSLPWKNIMISGWCLAEDKTKMSKSKGNVVTPEKLIDQYGADVVRYWASTSKLGADTAYSEDVIKNGKRLVNKIWNAAKFASSHFDKLDLTKNPLDNISHSSDKWLMSHLHNLVLTATKEFNAFEYASAMEAIEEFFWKVFCDNYLEISKARAYDENNQDFIGQQSAISTLYIATNTLLKLMAPVLPHITEELYQNLYSMDDSSIHQKGGWPDARDYNVYLEDFEQGQYVIEIIELIRKAKAERNLSVKADIANLAIVSPVIIKQDLLEDLAKVTASKSITQESAITSTNILEGKNVKLSVDFG